MKEEEFKEALGLAISYTVSYLAEIRTSIQSLINEIEQEKKNLSNEVRRSVYYLTVSNEVKMKRVKYIDEILIPGINDQMKSDVNKVFPDTRTTSLNRLKRFRKERARILKITGDHNLRVKQNARLLIAAYDEITALEKKYTKIKNAQLVRHFLESNQINGKKIINDEVPRLYRTYIRGGL